MSEYKFAKNHRAYLAGVYLNGKRPTTQKRDNANKHPILRVFQTSAAATDPSPRLFRAARGPFSCSYQS